MEDDWKEDWENMVFPCCKIPLPAPLYFVETAQCECGQKYTPLELELLNAERLSP